jgi:hypothetical protein
VSGHYVVALDNGRHVDAGADTSTYAVEGELGELIRRTSAAVFVRNPNAGAGLGALSADLKEIVDTAQVPNRVMTRASHFVVGARVLVEDGFVGNWGHAFRVGRVVQTPSEVVLHGGEILPTSARACALERPDLMPPDGRFVVSTDGIAWVRPPDGPAYPIPGLVGAAGELGNVAVARHRHIVVEVERNVWQRAQPL